MKPISMTLSVIVLLFAPRSLAAQTKIITTIAGNHIAGYTGDGGPATAAELVDLYGIAFDYLGNTYIADSYDGVIRKINTSGIISTVVPAYGPAYDVLNIAVDATGDLYISYPDMDLVKKVSGGVSNIVAGGVGSGYTGDGGPATLAKMNSPQGLAVDVFGNLYIADVVNNVIRKVDAATGIISTIAGTGTAGFYLGEGGPATAAELYGPQYVAVDALGNVYVNDGVARIRKIVASSGNIYTIAGNGTYGFSGDGGPATDAPFFGPNGIAVDGLGNVYIADGGNNRIRKVTPPGIITTIAGNGTGGYAGTGGVPGGYTGDGGPADSSELYAPAVITVDADGNLLIADAGNYVVRKISSPNNIFFTWGASQSLSACENASVAINSLLAITDTTVGETNTWSVILAPVHGAVSASYSATSTGGVLTPAGLTYTPTSYYIGTDSFVVKATNGNVTAYTTITVTVRVAPILGITSTYSGICNGSGTRIIITGNGTPSGGDTILNQNFNATLAPWTVDTTGSAIIYSAYAGWKDVLNDYANLQGVYHNPDSTPFALADAYGAGALHSVTKTRLISPSFSTVGYTNAALYFSQSYKNYFDTSAEIDASIDGGLTWTTLVNYALTTPTDLASGIHPFLPKTVSLAAYAGLPDVRLRFYYNTGLARYWAIDDIVVVGYPTGIGAATWTPATDLYTNSSYTSPYTTGAYRDTVYMHPTTVTATTNFTYYATESISGCSATDSITITVTPSVPIIGNAVLCVGAHDTLADATPFGSWTATNSNAFVGFSTGIVTGLLAGVDTIKYTATTGSCAGIATFTVTVSAAAPVAGTITGASTICAGATASLSDAITGGAWSSNATSIATAGSTGTVYGVAAGSAIISYSVVNGCGAAVTVAPITVNPLPVAGTISGIAATCALATAVLSDATAGGTWSTGTTGIATVDISGVITGVSDGIATISYSVANGCGTSVAAIPVTVDPLPVAGTIAGAATVCVLATTALSDAITGGMWTSSATSIATIDGTGIVTGISGGIVTVSYLVANTCGTAVATMLVTVNSLPVAGTITGTATLCALSTTTLIDAATGGIWTSVSAGVATVSTTGIVTGVAAGTTAISYSVTNSCGSMAVALIVTVDPLPTAGVITGTTTVCTGASITLTDTETGGIWSSSNSAATVLGGAVTGVTAGTDTISYAVTNICGTTAATSVITVNTLPSAGIITGDSTVCSDSTIALMESTAGGAWSGLNTAAAVSGTGIVTGVSPGIDTIVYTVTNSCGTAHVDFKVQIRPDSLCEAQLQVYPAYFPSNGIKVFPDPNYGIFTLLVSSGIQEPVLVTITNMVGEEVREFTVTTNVATNVALVQNAGIFILSATTKGGRLFARVVVE